MVIYTDEYTSSPEEAGMKRKPDETRARILAAAYALFYRKGFHRTSLDEIALKAKVTKRTLYYHFRSKDELAGAMLEHRHAFVVDQVAKWIEPPRGRAEPGILGARKLIDRLFKEIADWAKRGSVGTMRWTGPHWTGSGFTRMAVELADLPGHPARTATRRTRRR